MREEVMNSERQWVKFFVRMPTREDADKEGNVELMESNGRTRVGMWDWVRRSEDWHNNGFTAWRQR